MDLYDSVQAGELLFARVEETRGVDVGCSYLLVSDGEDPEYCFRRRIGNNNILFKLNLGMESGSLKSIFLGLVALCKYIIASSAKEI